MATEWWNKPYNPVITVGSYTPQTTFTSSMPTTESPEQSTKYIPSHKQGHKNDAIRFRSGALIVNCELTQQQIANVDWVNC